jgi:hypothetical protein
MKRPNAITAKVASSNPASHGQCSLLNVHQNRYAAIVNAAPCATWKMRVEPKISAKPTAVSA